MQNKKQEAIEGLHALFKKWGDSKGYLAAEIQESSNQGWNCAYAQKALYMFYDEPAAAASFLLLLDEQAKLLREALEDVET